MTHNQKLRKRCIRRIKNAGFTDIRLVTPLELSVNFSSLLFKAVTNYDTVKYLRCDGVNVTQLYIDEVVPILRHYDELSAAEQEVH